MATLYAPANRCEDNADDEREKKANRVSGLWNGLKNSARLID